MVITFYLSNQNNCKIKINNQNLEKINSLDLKIKHKNYYVQPKALEINKINIFPQTLNSKKLNSCCELTKKTKASTNSSKNVNDFNQSEEFLSNELNENPIIINNLEVNSLSKLSDPVKEPLQKTNAISFDIIPDDPSNNNPFKKGF